MARVAIIDYGMGNLVSVAGAVERLGHEALISHDADTLEGAACMILPGVGAFGDAMDNLHERRLIAPLTEMVLEIELPPATDMIVWNVTGMP